MKRLAIVLSSLLVGASLLVNVSAASAAGTNLIANPGFETASGANPASWTSNKWGTHNASFNYDTTGRSGSRAASVKVSNYTSGDAKWYFAPVTVTPNATYTFSNWYKSTAASGLDAVVTTTSGSTSYVWIANVPASAAWKQQNFSFKAPANAKQVTFYHYLDKNGTLSVDDYSLTANDGTTTPPPATAPTVSLTTPANNATVSATQSVTASATDAQAVKSVQFKLDGANLGAADTSAPYSVTWDTKAVANGAHVLTAVATNSANLTTTSTATNVTVANPVTPPPAMGNLIANPSVETANGAVPAKWISNSWGTNTSNFGYETNGQDGLRSLKATISSYSNGDAKWYFEPVTVTPNVVYNYSQWYKSNIETEVDAMVTMNDGTIQYFWLGSVPASPSNWQKLNYQFTPPANAAKVTVFQVISKVGYVQTDNVSFAKYAPAQLNRGLVSLTFDDGWRNIYTNGLPALKKYGLPSTQYLNSDPIVGGYPDYMTYQMVKDFAAAGHELGWHTRSHADITTLTAANLTTQLTIPQAFLSGLGQSASVFKNFASPYGAYNPTSVASVMSKYQTHRSTDVGYNAKDTFDAKNIKVQNITNATTPADVQNWVNQAIANKTWLVIVYHEVSTSPNDPTYAVTPANLDAELNIIKQSGVTVKTLEQALAEITPQL